MSVKDKKQRQELQQQISSSSLQKKKNLSKQERALRLADELKGEMAQSRCLQIFRQASQYFGLIQMILPQLLKEQITGIKEYFSDLSEDVDDENIKKECKRYLRSIANFQNQNQKKQPAQKIQKKQPIQEIQKEHCFWATLKQLWKIFKWEMSILAAITVYYLFFQLIGNSDQRAQAQSSCKALEENQFQCTPAGIALIKNTCNSVNQPKTALTLWFWIPVGIDITIFNVLIFKKIFQHCFGSSERLKREPIKSTDQKKQSKKDSQQQNMFDGTVGHNKNNQIGIDKQLNDEQQGKIPECTDIRVRPEKRENSLIQKEEQKAQIVLLMIINKNPIQFIKPPNHNLSNYSIHPVAFVSVQIQF